MKHGLNLSTLRDEVASLRALPCRLAHEQVLIGETGIQRRRDNTENDPGVARVGLCPKAVRDSQLSCAHTRARERLRQALAACARAGILPAQEAARMEQDLERIGLAIHATDWEKNQAEVRYALLLEQGAPAGSAKERAILDALIVRHEELTAELDQMHGFLLRTLKEGDKT